MRSRSLASVLVLCLLFIWCTGVLAEKVTLTWTVKTSNQQRIDIWTKWATEFTKLYPDVEVKLTLPGSGYEAKLKTWIAGGEAPDIMWMGANFFDFASVLLPLNDLYSRNKDIKEILPNMIAAHSINGKLLALPYGVNTHAVFYDQDALDASGIKIPKGWTWDDAMKFGKQLTVDKDGDGVIDRYAYSFFHPTWWWQYGDAAVYTSDYQKTTVDNPVTIAAIQFWADFFGGRMGVQATPQDSNDILNGKAVAGNRGIFDVPLYRDKEGLNWDVVDQPLFVYNGKSYYTNFYSAETWTVTKDTKHPAEALKFMEFIMSKEKNTEFGMLGGIIPTQSSVAVKTILNTSEPKNVRVFVDCLNYWNYGYFANPALGVVKAIWANETFTKIMTGEIPAASGVPEIASQVNKALDEYWSNAK